MIVNGLSTTEIAGNGTEIVMTVLPQTPSFWDTLRGSITFASSALSLASGTVRVVQWLREPNAFADALSLAQATFQPVRSLYGRLRNKPTQPSQQGDVESVPTTYCSSPSCLQSPNVC